MGIVRSLAFDAHRPHRRVVRVAHRGVRRCRATYSRLPRCAACCQPASRSTSTFRPPRPRRPRTRSSRTYGGRGDRADPEQEQARATRRTLSIRQSESCFAAADAVLDLLIPAAHAQADLNIATPAVRQLTSSMEARHAQLRKSLRLGRHWPDAGRSGGDSRSEPRASAERNALRKLVADENADRANLYREIAAANGHPEWESGHSRYVRRTLGEQGVRRLVLPGF